MESHSYASQFGQDRFLDRFVFRQFRGGVFVDVGAHDGQSYSNSAFFERGRDWRGLCIEPNPAIFTKLRTARRAECIRCCVAAAQGEVDFLQVEGPSDMLSGMLVSYPAAHRDRLAAETVATRSRRRKIKVPARPLRGILAERDIREVHYLSIDIEGGEIEALNSLDFRRVFVHAVTVENNYGTDEALNLLRYFGFVPLVRLAVDTVYINRASAFFSRALVARSLLLRAAARAERKMRKVGLLRRGEAHFPYKAPR